MEYSKWPYLYLMHLQILWKGRPSVTTLLEYCTALTSLLNCLRFIHLHTESATSIFNHSAIKLLQNKLIIYAHKNVNKKNIFLVEILSKKQERHAFALTNFVLKCSSKLILAARCDLSSTTTKSSWLYLFCSWTLRYHTKTTYSYIHTHTRISDICTYIHMHGYIYIHIHIIYTSNCTDQTVLITMMNILVTVSQLWADLQSYFK